MAATAASREDWDGLRVTPIYNFFRGSIAELGETSSGEPTDTLKAIKDRSYLGKYNFEGD
jgi:hypothetical protein